MLEIRAGANIRVDSSVLASDSSGAIYVDDSTRPTISSVFFASDAGIALNAPVDTLYLFTNLHFAPGQAPLIARPGTIQTTQTWLPLDVPVILTGTITLAAGTTLTIQPGTTLELGPGALIQVDGTLHAVGTAVAPITFTSVAAALKPGDWQVIRVENATASKTVFSHCQVLNGGYDHYYNLPGMLLIRAGANILVTDSSFAQGSNGGIYVDSASQPTIAGNSFSGIAGAAILVPTADQPLVRNNTFGQGQKQVEVHT
jgi:parallel beta-helix repeat protein